MNKDELIILKDLVDKEIEKRKRINELLENETVQEYLRITNTDPCNIDSDNIREVLSQILKTWEISKTNGIYVCTSSYYMDCKINYEDSEFFSHMVPINSRDADYRIYQDIESEVRVQAAKNNNNPYLIKTNMHEFERDHIVLNPYNNVRNQNGYSEVRLDFFENALKYGQAKSKKLLLEKYPRL